MSVKPGRNDPCPCGSGKKYKKCCQEKSEFNPPAPEYSGKVAAPTTAERNQLVALFNAGRHAELEARTRLLLERYPDSGFAWKVLGATLQIQGKDSLLALQKSTELLPNDAEAHYNLGNTFKELGRPNEAEASYRRALQINPDFAMAHSNLGITLHDMRRLGEAEASYRRALQINPNFGAAHFGLGVTLQSMGRLDEAEASFRRALQIKPDYFEAYRAFGVLLHDMGRLDEAEASFRRALQIKPDYADAHSNLGVTLQSMGRLDEAEASFRRALELNPDYASAHGNLGELLMNQGKLGEALACFQEQLRLTPENTVARHLIASITGNNTERAPAQYVENIFDVYADKFDTHLQQILKYEAPEKLVALVMQHSTPPAGKWNVLDLGCGTGLVGTAIAPFARQLVGVDLSSKMLGKASERNLYQRLERMDLLTMMRGENASSYDVIIAADVFIYLGKLDEIVSEIRRLLSPGGIFSFSIEALDALPNDEKDSQDVQQEYQLGNTGRYSHSPNYITRLASANGFLAQEMTVTQLRMERDKPVNGYLVLWKNRGNNPTQ